MMGDRDPGALPSRWLNCPRKASDLIVNKFLAFKTPLSSKFDVSVPDENRFPPKMLFMSMKSYKVKIGLWIDLTNTSRFYDKTEIENLGSKYIKLQCRGHGETPSVEQTNLFIDLVSKFIRNNPLEFIGVHCTHGFNRTGFLIVSYMVEQMDCSVEFALREFSRVRPPGIYKQDYLAELYTRYNSDEDPPLAPLLPSWYTESDDGNGNDYDASDDKGQSSGSRGKRRKEFVNKNPVFVPGVKGVVHFTEQPKLGKLQKLVQDLCKWKTSGFPGSQPVSMDMKNIFKLQQKSYRVSWKADGTRYIMLIYAESETYLFDRDNCVFLVQGLKFFRKEQPTRHLKNTLLDGEMVIDKDKGQNIPRFLCYDIMHIENEDVRECDFYPTRLKLIEEEIIVPRYHAMMEGRIDKLKEPFSIRPKQFWDLTQAHSLLGEKFAKSLTHEPDGLIFQPSKEPYVAGKCDDVLKWKPLNMNSVDFKLKLAKEGGPGILPKKIGELYVGSLPTPYATMKYTKALANLDNKIIECKLENLQWVFMRERTDKSYPNSYATAQAVCESIKNPVTEHYLIDFIDNKRYTDDSEMMPPPSKRLKV